MVIFRKWVTNRKTGKRLHAKDYGLKAFPLKVRAQRTKRNTTSK